MRIEKYLIPLTITLILESLMSFCLLVRKKENYKRLFLINIITNPLLNLICNLINWKISLYICGYLGIDVFLASNIQIYILEVLVVIVEGMYCNKYMLPEDKFVLNVIKSKKARNFVYSLLLNMTSYFGGKMVHAIFNI